MFLFIQPCPQCYYFTNTNIIWSSMAIAFYVDEVPKAKCCSHFVAPLKLRPLLANLTNQLLMIIIQFCKRLQPLV